MRIGIPLADSFAVEGKEKSLRLPRDGGPVTVSWPCVPSRRGSYRIAALYVEVASPWRLWKIRVAVPVEMEIRVYPDLAMERSALAAVFLRRSLPGAVPWRQVGRGREFDKLREYQPGDAFDEIHWKATAKRNEPITKVFRVEQTQEVYVVIDASRLSGRRLRTPYADTDESAASLLERQVTAALALGAAAENQGDHFGLIAFSDRVRRFVRAKGGKATYQACREALLDLRPGEVSPDFHEVSAFVRSRLTRRALLVYLTYLDDPVVSEAFIHSIAPVVERHVVRVCMIRPSGVRPLFAGGVLQQDGELFERISGHVYWRHLDEAGKILRRKGAPFTLVEEEKTAAHLISQYMRVKQRQLL